MFLGMMFGPFILVALVLFLVYAAGGGRSVSFGCMPMAHGEGGHGGTTTVQPTAAEILKDRYARGEIDRDEFLQKLKDLS